jgi:hypothetical protein
MRCYITINKSYIIHILCAHFGLFEKLNINRIENNFSILQLKSGISSECGNYIKIYLSIVTHRKSDSLL